MGFRKARQRLIKTTKLKYKPKILTEHALVSTTLWLFHYHIVLHTSNNTKKNCGDLPLGKYLCSILLFCWPDMNHSTAPFMNKTFSILFYSNRIYPSGVRPIRGIFRHARGRQAPHRGPDDRRDPRAGPGRLQDLVRRDILGPGQVYQPHPIRTVRLQDWIEHEEV